MRSYTSALLATMVSTMAGNYLYAFLHDRQWAVAGERSFFQAMALAAYWLALTLSRAT